MKRWQLFLFAGVLAVLSGTGGYVLQQYQKNKNAEKAEPVKKQISAEKVIGQKVPDFSLADMEGEQRHLSEWQGKVIVLNFWATWCPPCREEIPSFVELQQQYANDGLQFIGIALQTAEEIRDFITEFQVNYPALVGGNDVIKVSKQLGNGIGALPYTVIMDRQGMIAFTRRGPVSKSEAESVIKTLL